MALLIGCPLTVNTWVGPRPTIMSWRGANGIIMVHHYSSLNVRERGRQHLPTSQISFYHREFMRGKKIASVPTRNPDVSMHNIWPTRDVTAAMFLVDMCCVSIDRFWYFLGTNKMVKWAEFGCYNTRGNVRSSPANHIRAGLWCQQKREQKCIFN